LKALHSIGPGKARKARIQIPPYLSVALCPRFRDLHAALRIHEKYQLGVFAMQYPLYVVEDHKLSKERFRAGLCADCLHARRIESSRGSVFYLCERSANNPAFPKYPQLPVIECPGHTPGT